MAQERATAKRPHVPPTHLLHDQMEQPYLELAQPAIPQPTGTFVPNSQTLSDSKVIRSTVWVPKSPA